MVDMAFPHHSYDDMSLEHLSQIREYGIERVETVTEVMRQRIREEVEAGSEIKKLSKQAGVTRATIYSWISK